jgi:hypothetical protein
MEPLMAHFISQNRRATLVVALGLALGCSRPPLSIEPIASSPAAASPQAADPALALDPESGDLLLTWVGGAPRLGWRLYFARSADGGQSWSAPAVITTDTGLVHPHGEAAPRLVAAPGHRVAVVWAQGFDVAGRQWPATRLRAARSLDGGTNWSRPITLNDDTTGAPISHTFQGAAWTGDSGLTVAWLDERRGGSVNHDHANHDSTAGEDATIFSVSSQDFGASWEPNRPLWGAVCPCCRVALARNPDGSTLAAWRKHYPGNVRDVVVGRIDDPQSEPTRVHRDDWEYAGCPHSGPAVAVDSGGRSRIVWYTGRPRGAGVYLVRGNGATGFESAPVALVRGDALQTAHPAVAALPGGSTLAAWDLDAAGKRGLSMGLVRTGESRARTQAVPGTTGASYPQLATLRDGGVAVAWTEVVGEMTRVRLARVIVR